MRVYSLSEASLAMWANASDEKRRRMSPDNTGVKRTDEYIVAMKARLKGRKKEIWI